MKKSFAHFYPITLNLYFRHVLKTDTMARGQKGTKQSFKVQKVVPMPTAERVRGTYPLSDIFLILDLILKKTTG